MASFVGIKARAVAASRSTSAALTTRLSRQVSRGNPVLEFRAYDRCATFTPFTSNTATADSA